MQSYEIGVGLERSSVGCWFLSNSNPIPLTGKTGGPFVSLVVTTVASELCFWTTVKSLVICRAGLGRGRTPP